MAFICPKCTKTVFKSSDHDCYPTLEWRTLEQRYLILTEVVELMLQQIHTDPNYRVLLSAVLDKLDTPDPVE